MDESKWNSRKLLVSLLCLGLAVALPIVYKKIEISDAIAITVEGIIASIMGMYGLANVVSKKFGDGP